jgi:hypothetical protein
MEQFLLQTYALLLLLSNPPFPPKRITGSYISSRRDEELYVHCT